MRLSESRISYSLFAKRGSLKLRLTYCFYDIIIKNNRPITFSFVDEPK
jgi:hypothetical protein